MEYSSSTVASGVFCWFEDPNSLPNASTAYQDALDSASTDLSSSPLLPLANSCIGIRRKQKEFCVIFHEINGNGAVVDRGANAKADEAQQRISQKAALTVDSTEAFMDGRRAVY
jgi:hypothetical protein